MDCGFSAMRLTTSPFSQKPDSLFSLNSNDLRLATLPLFQLAAYLGKLSVILNSQAKTKEGVVFLVILVTGTLVILCVTFHLFVLEFLAWVQTLFTSIRRWHIAVMVLGTIVGHLLEIWLFAGGFHVLSGGEHGRITGNFQLDHPNFMYYSAMTFTSLGTSITPTGPLRLVSAVEAVTGLVLITWSASYVFLVMQRSWDRNGVSGK